MLTNQPVEQAIVTLRNEPSIVESAKYLYFMQPIEQAMIIGELNKGEDEDKKLAGDILREYKKIGQDIPIE